MQQKTKMNKIFFKSLICLGFAATMCLQTVSAHAGFENVSLRGDIEQPIKKMGLNYDVYAGGFKALAATLEMDLDPRAYDMSLKAKTQGTIGSIFPWEATYATSGRAQNDGTPVPSIHTARSSWKKDEKVTEMQYSPQGTLLKTTTHEDNETKVKKDFDPELTENAVDMLTGALQMLQHSGQTEKCEGTFPVFDGKRRFNITLQDSGVEKLGKNKYSAFNGDALRCTLKVEPVAGFKKKDKERGWMAVQAHTEARKKPPTLWLAKLEEKGPMVPVRMEISSAYGSVVAHLSTLQRN